MMKNPAASSPASSAPFAAAGPPQAWWQAAKRGDVARLESLHAAGAEVNAIHRDSGQTALHMACQHGRNEAALWLLAHGAALNGATKWGETPLYKAVASGHEALVTTLLAQGADPNIGAGHHAPLAAAVFRNDVTLVKALLARGAAPHFPGIRNPLLSALLSTHREVLALLLAHGADPTRHEDLASAPLVQAVRQGDLAVLEMLLPHLPADHLRCAAGTQAVFESVMGDKPDMLAWLLRQGCPPDFGENTPEGVLPPLVMAAHLGNPVLVILLLRAQADVAADLSWNWMGNALVAACSGPAPHGEVIQALLANNVPLDGVDHNGLTAVHHALKGRHADILAQLLLAGATLPAGCRNAAFLLVAETGEVALAQRLLAEGAELECREQDANLPGDDGQPLPDAVSSRPNKTLGNFMKIFSEIDLDLESAEQRAEEKAKEHPWNGATPLFKAAAAGQAAMTRWLSEQGAEPNIRLDHGTLLLNEAVASNSLPTVEALLEHGADPNAQDSTGWSPLHQAAQGEAGDDHSPPTAQSNAAALNMAQCLHAHGAKLDVSDDEGWTPLLSALTEGRAPVAEWLLAQGADPLVTTADGYTALMAAAVGNLHQLFAPLLAAHGAASPLEITDDEGWTALGYAAHWGHAEAVSALLERGANPDHQTAEGKSADDLATAKGHHAVARLLLKIRREN